MGSLKRAIKRIPALLHPVAEALKRWRQHSEQGRVITRNIIRERFLPAHRMLALLKAVCDGPTQPIELVAKRYETACHKHVCKGAPLAPESTPNILGRAVDRDTFIEWLCSGKAGSGYERTQARILIRKLVQGEPLDRIEKKTFMSKHAAWVTWNPNDPSGDPFHFARMECSNEVRANLGLKRSGQRLILLVYDRGNLVLRKPTIADGELKPRFRPPRVGVDCHGSTKPWPGTAIPGTERHPEALHESAKLMLIGENKCKELF